MPKRARCPHCDRLFSRDKLDDHIHRCRQKQERRRESVPLTRRTVIVDGNNIAYHLSPDGKPRVANLSNAHHSLTSVGLRPVVVVSAALIHKIDRPNVLQGMLADGFAIQAPRGTDDDLKIINTALERNADIVSNDRFLNWIGRYPWLPSRLKRYRLTPSGLILEQKR